MFWISQLFGIVFQLLASDLNGGGVARLKTRFIPLANLPKMFIGQFRRICTKYRERYVKYRCYEGRRAA
jgi:hypothetical protein